MAIAGLLMCQYARLRTRLFTALLANQFGEIGAGTRIEPPFRGGRLNQIRLGHNVMINRDCWIQVWSNGRRDEPGELVIGSHAAIGMGATISAARRIIIGEFALLARNVYISDHGHAFYDVDDPIMNQGINAPTPVSI